MSKELAERAAKILDSKKAVDITSIEIEELTIIADYFLIATGTSNVHLRALADEVEEVLEKESGIHPVSVQGRATGWILMDYGSVVIHLFLAESRQYYNLERLWGDAKVVHYNFD